jgi:hypothetical protein
MFVAHCVAVAMTVSFTLVTFSLLSPFSYNPLADVRAKSKASWNISASIETILSGSSLFSFASSTMQWPAGLGVDHRVVLFDGALHDAVVPLFVPVDVDPHPQVVINAQGALNDL